jgi:hypothetical protein
MTEAEWLACEDVRPMLKLVGGDATDRQLRLLGCACVRRVWPLLNDRYAMGAINRIEEYVDGLRGEQAVRQAAQKGAWQPHLLVGDRLRLVARAVMNVVGVDARGGVLRRRVEDALLNARLVSDGNESAVQACLLRDVFGRGFCQVNVTASSLTPLVQNLAQAAYGERAFPSGELEPARLAVLADALDDAGCAERAILDHLRSPGPHVRGCWAIDLILGKD